MGAYTPETVGLLYDSTPSSINFTAVSIYTHAGCTSAFSPRTERSSTTRTCPPPPSRFWTPSLPSGMTDVIRSGDAERRTGGDDYLLTAKGLRGVMRQVLLFSLFSLFWNSDSSASKSDWILTNKSAVSSARS